VNVPVLWATADAAGYGTGLWATYKQWGEMGGQVCKGEQGTPVVYWKITKPSERGDTDGEDEAGGGKRGSFFVRYYNVFNLAQVNGATLPADTRRSFRSPRSPRGQPRHDKHRQKNTNLHQRQQRSSSR
jgi:antirestriction protein ArdC